LRPPVHKVSESAFFEDPGSAAGDKSRWRALAVWVGLLICAVLLSSLLYTGFFVSDPPALVVEAALRANEYLAHPDIVLVRRGFGYYSVVLVEPTEGLVYTPAVWFRVAASGEVLSVERRNVDPRRGHVIILSLESAGLLACITGLWRLRKEISGLFRPRLRS
jgi:hypothetical protein